MDSLSSLGKQAISAAQPAGVDVRDDDDFDALQNEIAKMSNPVSSGTLDWAKVAQLAGQLLSTKGKDLLVACYLAGALLQTEGLPGLCTGIGIVDDMLTTYWDTLYPPLQRLRGRRNALQWLIERIKLHGDEHDWSALPPQEPELIESLRNGLQHIESLLLERDDEAPSLRPTLQQLNTIPVKEPPPPEPEAPAPGTQPVQTEVAVDPANALALDTPEHVEQATRAALDRLGSIAAWHLDADPTQAIGYRLRRVAVWGELEAMPPLRDGRTVLPAPISALQDALSHLLSAGAPEDQIAFAETQLSNFPFWLDLNRVTALALEKLGGAYDSARLAVAGETAALILRLPELRQQSFTDGTRLADAQTLQWLDHIAGAGGDAQTGGTGSAASNNAALEAALMQARALGADDDLNGAAACLQQAIAQTTSPPARLQLRIALCELLYAQRPRAHLQPFALAIVEVIERHHLAEWDATLALQGLQAAYRILSTDEEQRPLADRLLARIASLDAGAAVGLVT